MEAREHLLSLGTDEEEGLLMLLRADQSQIGDDIRARFAGRQVQTLDQKEVLKEIYQATAVDPRIADDEALLEALISARSGSDARNAPLGVLDLDFAWSVILGQPDHFHQRPDLVEVLRWSIDETRWGAVKSLDPALIESFFSWVRERAGGVASCLETLFSTNQAQLYLPLGLVAGDLFHERLGNLDEAKVAIGRLDSYLNGRRLKPTEAAVWKAAAKEIIEKRPIEERERIAGMVDEILEGIGALDFANAFTFSRKGFRDRWLQFADDVTKLRTRKWESGSQQMVASLNEILQHALAPLHKARLKRAEMAARLASVEANQSSPESGQSGLSFLTRQYAETASFIDWARFSLSWGDTIPEVAETYAKLTKRVAKSREKEQLSFGSKLNQWHSGNEGAVKGLIPIEAAIEECLMPVAKQKPVLLLVMDGMNFPAFHQLSRSLEKSGWAAQSKVGERFPSCLLSVFPSVTKLSRWSLFSGKVQKGEIKTEVAAFRENPAFGDLKSRAKPLLFEKRELVSEDSAALSSEVREALAGSAHRVVAIVINAIDDQLKTGGQLSMDWSVDDIGILPAILEAADQGGRAIVMTSDHGHIPELANTRPVASSEGEARFRYGEIIDEHEMEFTGDRIAAATGGRSVILPVTESLRYGQKAAGYHGGACDLEALIPCGIFAPQTDEIEGYEAIDITEPTWWNWQYLSGGNESRKTPARVTKVRPKKTKKLEDVNELPLFEALLGETESAAPEKSAAWLEEFFQSEVCAEQTRLLGNAGPKKEHIRKVLSALDANRDTVLVSALATAIGEPSFRMKGLLSRVARFMNVDSYEVLEFDSDSGTVRLHRNLLAKQFQITL